MSFFGLGTQLDMYVKKYYVVDINCQWLFSVYEQLKVSKMINCVKVNLFHRQDLWKQFLMYILTRREEIVYHKVNSNWLGLLVFYISDLI